MTPYFIAFELMIYVLFFLCLMHALRSGPAIVWQLIAGVLFGVLLEYGTIQQLHSYSYGRFLIMIGDVPLPIGVAWGCIVYSARLFSEASGLPDWARPVLDGLFALNIDLSMDTVAIRLGFWNWAINRNSQFFGVPYANFWAWFWVVASFSAGLRLVLAWKRPFRSWLAPLGALIAGLTIVFLTNQFIYDIYRLSYSLYIMAVVLVLAGAVLLVILLHPQLQEKPEPAPATWVPLSFHAFFLVAGTVSGIYFRTPALLLVSLLMAAIGIISHRNAIFSRKPVRNPPPGGE
jgi:uncharacterized membrane protein